MNEQKDYLNQLKNARQYRGMTFVEEQEDERKSVRALIERPDGKFLLIRRAETDPNTSGYAKWELPGGGVIGDETNEEAIKRETKHETGLSVEVGDKVGDFTIDLPDGLSIDQEVYRCTTSDSETKLSGENNELKWVQYKDEVENLPMHPDCKKMVMKVLDDKRNKPLETTSQIEKKKTGKYL